MMSSNHSEHWISFNFQTNYRPIPWIICIEHIYFSESSLNVEFDSNFTFVKRPFSEFPHVPHKTVFFSYRTVYTCIKGWMQIKKEYGPIHDSIVEERYPDFAQESMNLIFTSPEDILQQMTSRHQDGYQSCGPLLPTILRMKTPKERWWP